MPSMTARKSSRRSANVRIGPVTAHTDPSGGASAHALQNPHQARAGKAGGAQMDAFAQRIAPPERMRQRLRDPANHRNLQGEPPIIDERGERFGMTQQSRGSFGQIADAA